MTKLRGEYLAPSYNNNSLSSLVLHGGIHHAASEQVNLEVVFRGRKSFG